MKALAAFVFRWLRDFGRSSAMPDIAAIILAAGRSLRFRAEGGREISKLVASLDGKPLVRHVAEAALASRARPVVVVTGHAQEVVEAALAGLPVVFANNAGFAAGLASSLKVGVAALPSGVAGALVLLGDMPRRRAGDPRSPDRRLRAAPRRARRDANSCRPARQSRSIVAHSVRRAGAPRRR